MLKEELSCGLNCDILSAGYQNGHIGELINNYKNSIIAMLGQWKVKHVIH